jgi:hypothetical protein
MAHAHTTGQGQRRAPQRKATTTASIRTVRCAGTPQPAKTAYAVAKATPPQAATVGVGHANTAWGQIQAHWRQVSRKNAMASAANMVTCKPEMLMRWATPVVRKIDQS